MHPDQKKQGVMIQLIAEINRGTLEQFVPELPEAKNEKCDFVFLAEWTIARYYLSP